MVRPCVARGFSSIWERRAILAPTHRRDRASSSANADDPAHRGLSVQPPAPVATGCPARHDNESLRELKPLEAIESLLDAALQLLARCLFLAVADPAPFLHQELLVLAIGL